MTDTNSADKKRMYCEVCLFFSGLWIRDPGHQNFESSVPKGHQNMNVFVGPCLGSNYSQINHASVPNFIAVRRSC